MKENEMESGCFCKNTTKSEISSQCSCYGEDLQTIPNDLNPRLQRLVIRKAGIEVLSSGSLQPYKKTLRELNLINVLKLYSLEPGLFDDLILLRTIYIHVAPSLTFIDNDVFKTSLPSLKTFRCTYTGLITVPNLKQLDPSLHLQMVDLDNNQIKKLTTGSIRIKCNQLLLNYNQIEEIEQKTFENSTIATLSLKGNKNLHLLHEDAFTGLESLRNLDLSETAITQLPTSGLKGLDVLRVEGTKTLKVFPSVYNFNSIQEVWLTYSCHCCAFHFPAQHDPLGYQKHQEMLKKMTELCMSTESSQLSRKLLADEVFRSPTPTLSSIFSIETFHQTDLTVERGKKIHALCGNISKNYNEVNCLPKPDAFNPCEDLMGNWMLRIAVWIVAVAALLGNLAVLLVLISSRFRMTVPKFLMCNLAIADLCMGVYLLLIAIMDARSIGYYFNHAIDWQSGSGCQIAGFLTVFASELSIFTLTVITSERWYTITYAIHLNKRLKLSTAAKIMLLGWIYSIAMAVQPFFGISSYSKTSICLPMENIKNSDLTYLVTLLVFNGLAFCIICTCYGRMYYSIKGGQVSVAPVARSDMRVAKRMALLVFTDFACWAPIAFFGLTALAGYPLIDVPKTKILLVFFYPLNSCANPYLYALLTQQYRRDMFILLSRYGLCSKKAAQYKGMNEPGGHRGGTGPAIGCATVGNSNAMAPNHRGSVLTTQTSFDCSTRPGSLSVVQEINSLKPIEIVSVGSIHGMKEANSYVSKDRDINSKCSSLL